MRTVLVMTFVLSIALVAQAQTTHDRVREALVVVVAEGLSDTTSACVGCKVTAASTGFFVSSDGLILTSYHTIKRLAEAKVPVTEMKLAILRDPYAPPRPATIEYYDAIHDVLLLRTVSLTTPYPYLRLKRNAKAAVKALTTRIYTYGYPEGYNFQGAEGKVKAFEGPIGSWLFLWTTDMEFKPGQSGSPVYLEEGHVVGLVKGTEAGWPKNNFLVPILYAMNMAPSMFETDGDPQVAHQAANVGTVRISATVTERRREERVGRREFFEQNDSCERERPVIWRVKPSEGWQLDPSKTVANVSASAGSVFEGQKNANSNEIHLTGIIRNMGDCVTTFNTVTIDVRGFMKAVVTFTEFRDVDVPTVLPVQQVQAIKGEPRNVEIPNWAAMTSVTYKRSDGTVLQQTGAGSKDGLSVTIGNAANTAAKMLSIVTR